MLEKTNVVFVTIDSLRSDFVGCLGNQNNPSPNIDALAKEGVLFSQAITNGPRTPSAFPAIMCSLYPLVSGEKGIPGNAVTWAEIMRKYGYKTAGFNLTNPFLSRRCGYHKGFDFYEDFWKRHEARQGGARKSRWKNFKKTVQDGLGRRNLAALLFLQALRPRDGNAFPGKEVTQNALSWVRDNGDRPFFVWLHYMDVHYPYLPAKSEHSPSDIFRYARALVKSLSGHYTYPLKIMGELYRSRIRFVDDLIGRFVAKLKMQGLYEKTAVVVTSDHGEMFNEHGSFTHGPAPYDELLRVPLIIKAPEMIEHRTIDRQVGLIDLAPTMLEMLKIEVPPSFQGKSFLPLMEGRDNDYPAYVFSEATHRGGRRSRQTGEDKYRVISCRGEGWKYILDEEGNKEELYDLNRDPNEKENLIRVAQKKGEELSALVRKHLVMVEEQSKLYEKDKMVESLYEEEEINRKLAALGYL